VLDFALQIFASSGLLHLQNFRNTNGGGDEQNSAETTLNFWLFENLVWASVSFVLWIIWITWLKVRLAEIDKRNCSLA